MEFQPLKSIEPTGLMDFRASEKYWGETVLMNIQSSEGIEVTILIDLQHGKSIETTVLMEFHTTGEYANNCPNGRPNLRRS